VSGFKETLADPAVEKLWMTRAKLVEKLPTQIFFATDTADLPRRMRCGCDLRAALRLIARA
jgi:hypothetical protein